MNADGMKVSACATCETAEQSRLRDWRKVSAACRKSLGKRYDGLENATESSRISVLSRKIAQLEDELSELREAKKMAPLTAKLHEIEQANEEILPDTCFFYVFLWVGLSYYKALTMGGKWVLDEVDYGPQYLEFFCVILQMPGGRAILDQMFGFGRIIRSRKGGIHPKQNFAFNCANI